jgi:hypothetical protein
MGVLLGFRDLDTGNYTSPYMWRGGASYRKQNIVWKEEETQRKRWRKRERQKNRDMGRKWKQVDVFM